MKNTFRIQLPHARRGGALLAALVVTVTIAVLGASLIQMSTSVTRRDLLGIDNKRAFYVAEAGLSESFLALTLGKSGNVGNVNVPAAFGDGLYWVEATELDNGDVALVSTGMCGTGRFALSMVVTQERDPVGSLGVFAGDDLTIGAGSVVDGYDSRDGTFDEQAGNAPDANTGEGARLTSNGDIVIDGDLDPIGGPAPAPGGLLGGSPGGGLSEPTTSVFGDVVPGPQGLATIGPGVLVTGTTAPGDAEAELPTIDVPVITTSGDLSLATGRPVTLEDELLAYATIHVAGGARLNLVGPLTLVAGSLIIDPDGTLAVDSSNGPVEVHVTDTLDLRAGSEMLALSSDPRRVAFLVSAFDVRDRDGDGVDDAPVRLLASGEYYGLFYVPQAELTIPGTLRVYGALAALRLNLDENSRVSFDQALSVAGGADGVTSPRLVSWRVVELPEAQIVNIRFDPRRQLDIQGIDPVPSPIAHQEMEFTLTYEDQGGLIQTWTGRTNEMNWDDVKTVIDQSWSLNTPLPYDPITTTQVIKTL